MSRTSRVLLLFSIVSRTSLIAFSSTKSRNDFHFVRSVPGLALGRSIRKVSVRLVRSCEECCRSSSSSFEC
jgi:hypothetical protein